MKLNLLLNQNDLLAGYINIDPLATTSDKNRGDILNLDWIAVDSSCEDIRAIDIIDYVDIYKKGDILRHWFSKLEPGGTITVGGNELYLVCRSIFTNEVDFSTAIQLLYGGLDNISMNRSGLLYVDMLIKLFDESNITVLGKKIEGYRYLIKGKKQ